MNRLWRISPDYLYAYTEDRDVWQRIRRYYPDFAIMAEYYRGGKLIGLQYRIPSARKRSIRRLLNVNVDCTLNDENTA